MQLQSKALLIRADASTEIGTGHVMRCLALAHVWQKEGGQAHFVMASPAPALEARLVCEGMTARYLTTRPGGPEDAEETIFHARRLGAEWIVVDGYRFDAAYQLHLKEAGLRLLVLDDYGHADHYYADLVLNQNIDAEESLYALREAHTSLLLGTRYVLLRREFWPWLGWRRQVLPVARRVLVTLGGADPDNVTLKVMRGLCRLAIYNLEVIVVVGASNPHYQALQAAAHGSRFETRIVRNVSNMPDLMAWADLTVSAGGSTSWELAFMGVPSISIILAPNQRRAAWMLDAQGVVICLGESLQIDVRRIASAVEGLRTAYGRRVSMTTKGQQLVDGYGGFRVFNHLTRLEE